MSMHMVVNMYSERKIKHELNETSNMWFYFEKYIRKFRVYF